MAAGEKNLNPTSFRIDSGTAEKFRQICSQYDNQDVALSKLIEAYEFQVGKSILSDKKDDIEEFERYVTILTRKYMSSLEDNINAHVMIRTEFEALLKSKEDTIIDLQEQLTVAKQIKEDAVLKSKALTDEKSVISGQLATTEKKISDMEVSYEAMLNDKDKLNRALTDSLNSLKEKIENISSENTQLKEKSSRTDAISMERDELTKEKHTLEEALRIKTEESNRHLSELQNTYEQKIKTVEQDAKFNLEKSLFDQEKIFLTKLGEIEEEKRQEINKYQQKYLELLERFNHPADDKSEREETQ